MSKTIIITGATGAMGKEAVRAMLKEGHKVFMTCRNIDKGKRVYEELKVEFPDSDLVLETLDLSSFDSIRAFVNRISAQKIDALFNNAGTLESTYQFAEDGYERTLTVNYLAPYLLTRLILPLMTNDGVVVNMVSLSCYCASLKHGLFYRRFSQIGAYSRSKLALLQFSLSLRDRGMKAFVADPGIVDSNMIRLGRWFDCLTDLYFRPLCHDAAKGVRPAVNALLTGLSSDGQMYYIGNQSRDVPKSLVYDKVFRDRLWEETERIVGLYPRQGCEEGDLVNE